MSKVGMHILDSLTKNSAPLENLLVLTHNLSLGEKLANMLEVPCSVLEVPMNVPVVHIATYPLVRKSSHIIELFRPTLENSIYFKALHQVLQADGKFVLALWNWDERYLEDQFWGELDYQAISSAVTSLAEQMSSAKEVRVTSDLGTDISFSVAGRAWITADGYCERGKLAQLPDGEIYTCPVEKTFTGRIVVDGTVSRLWLPEEPLELWFEAGDLVDASPRFIERIDRYAGGVRTIGEFAFGMNPVIKNPYANISTDEKEGGSVHFALGDSYHLGFTESIYHVDFIVRKPTIYVDGAALKNYLPIV